MLALPGLMHIIDMVYIVFNEVVCVYSANLQSSLTFVYQAKWFVHWYAGVLQKHMIETKNVNSLTPDGCLLIYSISFIYSNIILWTTILYVTCWCIIFYVFWLKFEILVNIFNNFYSCLQIRCTHTNNTLSKHLLSFSMY